MNTNSSRTGSLIWIYRGEPITMKILAVIGALLIAINAMPHTDPLIEEWEQYKVSSNKRVIFIRN